MVPMLMRVLSALALPCARLALLLLPAVALSLAPPGQGQSQAAGGVAKDGPYSLDFLQLGEQEAERARGPAGRAVHRNLYRVEVGFEIQDMRAEGGLTMVFEKPRNMMRLEMGLQPKNGMAWGHFVDRIDTTGWSELYIEATDSPGVSNDVRSYAAGYVEGLLTCVRLSEFMANTRQLLIRKEASAHALGHLQALWKKQLAYMKQQSNADTPHMGESPSDPYWKHIRYVLFQLWGLCDGYNKAARYFRVRELELVDLLVLNAAGELPQLMEAYSPEAVAHRAARDGQSAAADSLLQAAASRTRLRSRRGGAATAAGGRRGGGPMSRADAPPNASGLVRNAGSGGGGRGDPLDDEHWERRVVGSGRCSAMVRVAAGNSDLFVGHTTWDDYSKMTRVFKYYKIPLGGADTMATDIAFSSYPGVLSSTDDFYVTDSGLSVMETSIIVLNDDIWDSVADFPEAPHVPNFAHIMATTRLAKSASHWSQLFTDVNTGTYAAQWMVVDYNQFQPGSPPGEGTLWVVEAVPGVVHMEDMTEHLRDKGYWPSFNRPFFPAIREASGHADAERSNGMLYSWDENPRAEIFAAAAPGANTLADMRTLMHRNLYPHSRVRPASPGHEISARMDLVTGSAAPNGGIDAKVAGRCLVKRMAVQAVSGPSHEALPVFSWVLADGAEAWPGWPHAGQPNSWDFGYVQMTPTGQVKISDIVDC